MNQSLHNSNEMDVHKVISDEACYTVGKMDNFLSESWHPSVTGDEWSVTVNNINEFNVNSHSITPMQA